MFGNLYPEPAILLVSSIASIVTSGLSLLFSDVPSNMKNLIGREYQTRRSGTVQMRKKIGSGKRLRFSILDKMIAASGDEDRSLADQLETAPTSMCRVKSNGKHETGGKSRQQAGIKLCRYSFEHCELRLAACSDKRYPAK